MYFIFGDHYFMKKYILLIAICSLGIALISWDYKGHKAVAAIAENHLNPNVKAYVTKLLGGQKMSDVASWADEIKNDPAYHNTASWHYLNLPAGLTYEQFLQTITSNDQPTIFSAILSCEKQLASKSATTNQKRAALKFLIHFVGDAHQPMHVSRAEDKGGNNIEIKFDNAELSLHSLWDGKLMDHEGLSDKQIAKEYDTATPEQISKWQHDPVIIWLWESYQISTILYKEVETNNDLNKQYYSDHIGIVHNRIEKAGIRLAGELNRLLDDTDTRQTVNK